MIKLGLAVGAALVLALAGCTHADREANAPTTSPASDTMQSEVTDMPAPVTMTPSPAVAAPAPSAETNTETPATKATPPSAWTETNGLTDYGKRIFDTPEQLELPPH